MGAGAHAGAAGAEEKCISPKRATEKMQGDGISFENFTGAKLDSLGKAYAARNPGHHLMAADEAIVFHRIDNPLVGWVILFRGGCAIGQAPIEEKTVRDAVSHGAAASPGTEPEASGPSAPGAAD